jgi:hypothetical protein
METFGQGEFLKESVKLGLELSVSRDLKSQ